MKQELRCGAEKLPTYLIYKLGKYWKNATRDEQTDRQTRLNRQTPIRLLGTVLNTTKAKKYSHYWINPDLNG